jgi:hypothetical protein
VEVRPSRSAAELIGTIGGMGMRQAKGNRRLGQARRKGVGPSPS